MDQIIMREWLLAFYSHIGKRAVLLTMDNFAAHLAGLELAHSLPNIRFSGCQRIQPANVSHLIKGLFRISRYITGNSG